MKRSELIQAIEDLGIDVRSITFYQSLQGEAPDSIWTTCDLTGERTSCCTCIARLIDSDDIAKATSEK